MAGTWSLQIARARVCCCQVVNSNHHGAVHSQSINQLASMLEFRRVRHAQDVVVVDLGNLEKHTQKYIYREIDRDRE